MATPAESRHNVWVLLIERDIEVGADLTLFWQEAAASAAAWEYLVEAWPDGQPFPTDVQAAIEIYNQQSGVGEHVLVAAFPVAGREFYDGDDDPRRRCALCGEPVELAEPGDSASWVHTADANDRADHSAEVD